MSVHNIIQPILAGMTLSGLKEDYRNRIFNEYLPFWNKGGYDDKMGGFICELYDDGSVEKDEKYIWYQGRGIWVYSYLYSYFGKEASYLEIAQKSRNFLVDNMYLGYGRWLDSVNGKGKPVENTVGQGSNKDIYGSLFSAAGLIELYKATGNNDDIDIAVDSIKEAVKIYEQAGYEGIEIPGIMETGLRTQGHSFVLIWILTNLLSFYRDEYLEKVLHEHVDHIINHFWNPDYNIVNEYLKHDYSRIKGMDRVMMTGHSLEALWMVYQEAIRIKNLHLQKLCRERIRHLINSAWDYSYGGLCTEKLTIPENNGKPPVPDFSLKSMWAHTELLIATMMIFEHTGEAWAAEWYERGRNYCHRYMTTSYGVWRQAVDRFGNDLSRPGISIYRKDNFHQIRYLMMNYLSLERIINNVQGSVKN